ncbi:helix-turn-helix domain-containing protein [Actinocorallia longicatena]|uniref:Helix-turn-helix domain-containing protein n=1 Tax=Actinocorallia longicatena TaxID=111803 RepID=A0ABP6QJ67_9ACTN
MSDAEVAEVITVMRDLVPDVSAEAVAAIEERLPEMVRPHDPRYAHMLGKSVRWMIAQFVDLIEDDEVSLEPITEFFHEFGVWTAEEGLSPEAWHAAFRLGSGITIGRLAEAVQDQPGVTPAMIGQVAQKVSVYLDRMAAAMAAGHEDADARTAGDQLMRRQKLIEVLVSSSPNADEIWDLALQARWKLPQTAAAVALRRRDPGGERRAEIPANALAALHLSEPCLIVPDPDGPGQREALAAGLGDWIAAIGPTTGTNDLARSLSWARRALALAEEGFVPCEVPVIAADHIPLMQAVRDRDMTEHLVALRLAPLMTVRAQHRRRLAETLLICLECGFNASDVAKRLYLHAQTVRYRLRQLEELFGEPLQDPAHHLELNIALRYWLAVDPAP